MSLTINVIAEDSINLDDENIIKAFNYIQLFDGFFLDFFAKLNSLPYVVLSLDNDGQHPSIHSYPFFTSFCEIENELYGTTEDGIYKISGTTDINETIHTGVVFKTDFSVANQKRLRLLILTGEINNVIIQASVDDIAAKSFSLTNNHCYIDNNYVGHNWDLRITDFDSLDFIDIIPTVLGRR